MSSQTTMQEGKIKLSFSRISRFIQCPKLYKYIYIDENERPDNEALEYGRKVHSLIQRLSLEVLLDEEGKKRDTDPQEIEEWFVKVNEEYKFSQPEKEKWRLIRVAEYLSDKDFTQKDVEKKILLTELKAELEGTIDNLHFNQDGEIIILDYKTTRQTIDSDEIESDLQLNIYAYLISQQFKDIPDLRIKIGIWFWRYGGHDLVEWKPADFGAVLKSKIDMLLSETEFPRQINQFCKWCPMIASCEAKDLLPNASYGECKDRIKFWTAKGTKARESVDAKFEEIEEDFYIDGGYRYKLAEEDVSEVDKNALFEMLLPDFEESLSSLRKIKKEYEGKEMEAEVEYIIEKLRDLEKGLDTLQLITKPLKTEAKKLRVDLPIAETKKKPKLYYSKIQ